MKQLLYKELSYELVGMFFEIQKQLGRFCRERQYGDCLEVLLKNRGIEHQREYPVPIADRASNFVDFLIDDTIIVELKAKPFITKEDYFQMQRYLQTANKEMGILINFRQYYLRPKRILNSHYIADKNDEVK